MASLEKMTTSNEGYVLVPSTNLYERIKNIYSVSLNVLATLIVSIAMGMSGVLLPVLLEENKLSSSITGMIMSLESIAALLMCLALPRMLLSLGMRMSLVVSTIIRVPAVAIVIFSNRIELWLPLVFSYGVGCFTFLIILQTWVSAMPVKKNRGLIISLYSTSISIGLSLGPIIINAIEKRKTDILELVNHLLQQYSAYVPIPVSELDIEQFKFFFAALLHLLSLLPVLLAYPLIPEFYFDKSVSIWRTIMGSKGYMFAIAMAGVSIFGVTAFITIYGLRNGLSLEDAALLLTSFMLGSLFLEIPLSWLSDYFDRRYVIVVCAFLSMVLCCLSAYSHL